MKPQTPTDRAASVAFFGPGDLFNPDRAEDTTLTDRLFPLLFDLYKQGYRNFYTGMEEGFDLMAANVVVALKKSGDYKDIKLFAEIAWDGKYLSFVPFEKALYEDILLCCDGTNTQNPTYFIGASDLRDEELMQKCALALVWDDGTNLDLTVKLETAAKMGMQVVNMYDFEVSPYGQ